MARKRKAISKVTRFEIFKRDGFSCQYCGRTPPAVVLQLDHITPHSKGGADDPLNLLTACQECNLGKTDRELSQVPAPLKNQMEEQRERREQIERYNAFLTELRGKQDADIEELGLAWFRFCGKENYVFGPGRAPSIRNFLKRLPKVQILEAMEIAHQKFPAYGDFDAKTFRYFCGICWRTIERAEAANG